MTNIKRNDGFYWVRIEKQDGVSKWIVALFEEGEWSVPAIDAALHDEHFAEIKESKIRPPDVDLHEEFEEIWVASGEGFDKPKLTSDGEYSIERARDAFQWFECGAGVY